MQPLDVATRAQCVLALMVRQQVEDALSLGQAMTGPLAKLARFLEDEGLAPHLDEVEAALLATPVGAWSATEVREAAWRIERLAVLLWALNQMELPAQGVPVNPDAVWGSIALMGPTSALVDDARLREGGVIDRARRATGVWRWRIETELKHRAGQSPTSGDSYEEMIQRAADRAAGLVEVQRGDLVVGGVTVQELSEAKLHEAASAIIERDEILRWLVETA